MYRACFGVSLKAVVWPMEKLPWAQKISINYITIYCECKARFSLCSNVEMHHSMTKEKKK